MTSAAAELFFENWWGATLALAWILGFIAGQQR